MKLTDERIIKFLDEKLSAKGIERDKFLNPSLNDLRDANKLKNMSEAVKKIKEAIKNDKKILIFGDYDSDGVCSSAILYLYFKSIGKNVQVYIPNRFHNGYGISCEAIDEIEFEYAPDLVITVDLGITAIEEVEILKQENIDVVITDHHIPLSELPSAVVVDPKIDPDGTYGFDSLCGAGVALKLIEALSDRQTALKFLDICAIATVGDIVPLVDENRVIAKFGIEKINSGDCLPSLTFIKNKCEIDRLTSTDISFKIVPKINACGRMSSAIKAFEFLVEDDPKQLEIKYAEIESDNMLRLSAIEKGNKEIAKILEKYDASEPAILIKGDFHEGIIGILASRVCHDQNRPAIIFTMDENGNYKGSGRSTENIDIHKIIVSLADLLENFGGHKMACGLEICPENFEIFKQKFIEKVSEFSVFEPENFDEKCYDIEINDEDINLQFISQLNLLEPFGCENEKPILAIKQGKMLAEPVSEKAFKHYRFWTKKNNSVVCFNGYDEMQNAKTMAEKLLVVDLSTSTYKGRENINVVLKNMTLISPNFEGFETQFLLGSLINKYFSIFDFNNKNNYHLTDNLAAVAAEKFKENSHGTMVVASSDSDLEKLEKHGIDTKSYLSFNPQTDCKNVIVCKHRGIYKLSQAKGYKNIIFMNRYFDDEHLYFSQQYNVYENITKMPLSFGLNCSREVFVKAYKLICDFAAIKANDECEFAEKLALKDKSLSSAQILFCLLVFMELNFCEYDEVLCNFKILKAKKMELSSSKLYLEVSDGK